MYGALQKIIFYKRKKMQKKDKTTEQEQRSFNINKGETNPKDKNDG